MKITDIRTMRLAGPDYHGIGGEYRQRAFRIVRVDTDAGLYGLGEAQEFMGVRDIINYCKDYLVGKDPLDIQPFVTAMLYGRKPPGQPRMSPTATPYGLVPWGVSGVEMALCDLAGKALNTPTYNLLGGKYRDRIAVYLDRSSPKDPTNLDAWKQIALDARERGFRWFKFDVDAVAPDFTDDLDNRTISLRQMNAIVKRLAAARDAVGEDVEMMIDGHMYYDVPDAIRLANELAPLKLTWLEDPTPITNPDALALVREKSPIPLCTGEMFIREQFRLVIDRAAVDIIHPDVLFCGGLHEAKKIADYAESHYLPLAMHGNGSGLAAVAASHVAAASRNFLALEYHYIESPWISQIVERDMPFFQDGAIQLTNQPGLGIELNNQICRQYLAEGETLL